jgi:histidine phosphotransferase ChpT
MSRSTTAQPALATSPLAAVALHASEPSDLELAALISSKICHDVIGPVGAINNGFQILDEDKDEESRTYALDVIRNVAELASVKLQFARFAYGAAGSAGATIDLQTAEQISRAFVEQGKHKLLWSGPAGQMSKDRVKLLLNMVSASITALPRGGEISVTVTGGGDAPKFVIRCRGQGARPPHHLAEFLAGDMKEALHALTIQPYYTCRLARQAGMQLTVIKDSLDIVLTAASAN